MDDHREFEGVAGIVGDTVRNGRCEQVAVAVLMLQALAVQCRAASSGTHQETPRLHVAASPCQVADALEAEHGVEDVERNERVAMGAVRGRGGKPSCERARFVDAFFQNLPVLGLAVGSDFAVVLGLVELPFGRVDAQLPKHAFHAEGAGFVWNDRHDALSQIRIARQRRKQAHERHRRGNSAFAGALQLLIENGKRRHRHVALQFLALRYRATQLGALAVEIDHLRRIRGRAIVGHVGERIVAQRNVETIAKAFQIFRFQLLDLMRGVFRFAGVSHAVALHRLRENHRRFAGVVQGGVVCGVDLERIVAAAVQAHDVVVGKARHALG